MAKKNRRCKKCTENKNFGFCDDKKCSNPMSHTLTTQDNKIEYHKIDHSHCWSSKNPPCGQKIKHFECCLCKEPHPDIVEREQKGRDMAVDYIAFQSEKIIAKDGKTSAIEIVENARNIKE